MENDPDRVDYDVVIQFYQDVLRKEREQIEEEKKKKLREVELWTRALREEEKLAIEKYALETVTVRSNKSKQVLLRNRAKS